MKYRVIERIFEDESTDFTPQYKWGIFWHCFTEYDWEDPIKVRKHSLEDAEKYIKQYINYRKGNHCINKIYYEFE